MPGGVYRFLAACSPRGTWTELSSLEHFCSLKLSFSLELSSSKLSSELSLSELSHSSDEVTELLALSGKSSLFFSLKSKFLFKLLYFTIIIITQSLRTLGVTKQLRVLSALENLES